MDKVDWVENLLNIPPADRVKKIYKTRIVSVNKKTPQFYMKKQRRMQRPNWLIQICNQNKIFSMQILKQYNLTHQPKISLSSIKYWFGSWKAFKRRLELKSFRKYKYSQKQIIDLCVRFNIDSLNQYQQYHKKQPTIFPSSDWIVRHFGGWKFYKRILQACSVQSTLQRYVSLKMQLGRYPSRLQCKRNNISIQLLLDMWQPQQLRDTVKILQDIYKNASK